MNRSFFCAGALALLLSACSAPDNNVSTDAATEQQPTTSAASTMNADNEGTESTSVSPVMTSSSEPGSADACGASRVAPWIGQEATVPVRIAAAQAAGAASDRWIYPDSVVIQDKRMDRLNVLMEKDTNVIVRAYCG